MTRRGRGIEGKCCPNSWLSKRKIWHANVVEFMRYILTLSRKSVGL